MSDTLKLTRRSMFFIPVALAACKFNDVILKLSGNAVGTSYSIVARDPSHALRQSDVQKAVARVVAQVNSEMSNWDSSSEISRFNASRTTDPVTVSPAFADVVAASQQVGTASQGQFDIALAPLIELWGFGATGTQSQVPDDGQINAALSAASLHAPLIVGTNTVQKTNPETQIFLSGIGKGHLVDRVADALAAMGIDDYMVEIGGDLRVAGRNPDGLPWQIGVETPKAHDRSIQNVVGLSDIAMATSGDYRNFFERDGQRYSHILDGHTGRPVTHHTASATVLTKSGMMADAWATAMLSLGRERGLEIAEAQNLAVLFLERDTQGGYTRTQTRAFTQLTTA